MPTLRDFPFAAVAAWMRQGGIVPFLGAGASRVGKDLCDPLPSGQELASELIAQMGGQYMGGDDERLAKVAQIYESTVLDRAALHEYLHRRLAPRPRAAPFPSVHSLLADLPQSDKSLIMVTTNYDSEVERAFQKSGKTLHVATQHLRNEEHGVTRISVRPPDGESGYKPAHEFLVQPEDTAYLYKMHGSAHWEIDDDRFDVIITEDDYTDMLGLIGGGSAYVPPPALTAELKKRRFLFLGYSLEDWTLRVLMRLLQNRNALKSTGRLRHFAIQLKPSPLEEALWAQRNVTVFDGDLEDFCTQLRAELRGVN
ncbi:SIR2 family protein [Streptomyces sp. NPDC056468]|uniref:SIR2 family NAD-dependent protein deacylase n=1 Tax=unclassified Streptomyces TaxID=2593676 RepID=UPI00369C0962